MQSQLHPEPHVKLPAISIMHAVVGATHCQESCGCGSVRHAPGKGTLRMT